MFIADNASTRAGVSRRLAPATIAWRQSPEEIAWMLRCRATKAVEHAVS